MLWALMVAEGSGDGGFQAKRAVAHRGTGRRRGVAGNAERVLAFTSKQIAPFVDAWARPQAMLTVGADAELKSGLDVFVADPDVASKNIAIGEVAPGKPATLTVAADTL